MKKITIILLGFIALLAVSCDKDDHLAPDKSKYVYDIPQTDLPVDAIVGAYYTNITSSSSWLKSGKKIYAGTPLLGEYLSTTSGVLQQQLAWADEAALDFLIVTWDAASADNTLITNFKSVRAATNAKVRLVINYNTKHLKVSNDKPLQEEENLNKMINDFTNTLVPLFNDEVYYKMNGRPVILITPSNLSSSALKSIDYSLVIPALKKAVSELGYDLYTIGEFTTGWVAPVNYEEHQIASFDGVTVNDWSTNMYDRYYAFFSFVDLNWANWKTTISKWNTDFVLVGTLERSHQGSNLVILHQDIEHLVIGSSQERKHMRHIRILAGNCVRLHLVTLLILIPATVNDYPFSCPVFVGKTIQFHKHPVLVGRNIISIFIHEVQDYIPFLVNGIEIIPVPYHQFQLLSLL